MPERWNSDRWTKNEDGTYSKRYGAPTTILEPGAESGVPHPAQDESEDDVNITKAAAELAEELGVDVSEVEGSGAEGRITKGDVEAAASSE